MKNERKIAYQSQRIAELEKQVRHLEAENKSMSKDIDRYKNIISSKDAAIKYLNEEAAELMRRYDAGMQDIAELQSDLTVAIRDAKSSRLKYEKEMNALIERIRKGK